MQEICIGLDIGLTKISASFMNPLTGNIEICSIDQDDQGLPAYVRFRKDQRVQIGKDAKEAFYKSSTIYDIKRIIGRSNSSNVNTKSGKFWRFSLRDDDEEIVFSKNSSTSHNITFILSLLIKHLIEKIEGQLANIKISGAILSVPTQFSYQQTNETILAVQQTGVTVKNVLNEPTSAALTYLYCNKNVNLPRDMLFFDFGGGKLDVALSSFDRSRLNVVSVAGDNNLGGRDIENNIYKHLLDEIQKKIKMDPPEDLKRSLRLDIERIKITLSKHERTNFVFESEEIKRIIIPISRKTFEKVNDIVFSRCIEVVMACLKPSGIDKDNIKMVIISGGSSKIPRVKQLLQDLFTSQSVIENFHMENATCYGNSVHGIGKYATNEILSRGLGVLTHANIMDKIIPKHSKTPITGTKLYLTTKHSQQAIWFPILEGENIIASKNNIIGNFHIPIPMNAPPGYPVRIKIHVDQLKQLQITYEYPNDIKSNHIYIAEMLPIRYTSSANVDQFEVDNNTLEEDEENFRISCSKLVSYCTMIETVFQADIKVASSEFSKEDVIKELKDNKNWVRNLTYSTLLADEVNSKLRSLEERFEPRMTKYGHFIKDMNLLEFCNYMMNKNYTNDDDILKRYAAYT